MKQKKHATDCMYFLNKAYFSCKNKTVFSTFILGCAFVFYIFII